LTDNLFDRLRDLLQSSGPVNWRLAREVAESLAGEPEPVEPWVAEEFEELCHTAALRVASSSPLDPAALPMTVRTTDRRTWASRTTQGYAFLGEPLAELLTARPAPGPLGPMMAQLWPALLGMQLGSATGFMAQRVLGRFDVGLPPDDHAGPWFVVPNIESFAADHALDVRQTRLWLVLHEVIHHAEFAVPWVRDEYRSLVGRFVDELDVDADAIEEGLTSFQDPEAMERMLQDPGALTGLRAGSDAEEAAGRITAFMATLEGYADWLIDRAAPGLVPDAAGMRSALDDRRSQPAEWEQMLTQLIGLDIHHDHFRHGVTFCTEVARRWGDEALDRLWEGPEMLPDRAELEDVVGWAARTLL
jgi:putative hydrolase